MPQENDKIIFVDRQQKALSLAYGVVKSMTGTPTDVTIDEFFVVWFCKTLQNWKALVSAGFSGAPYVEVTYNGDKEETYLDVYYKVENVRIPN